MSTAIVVLDRQQGGVENLKNQGINIQVLFSISQVLKILLTNQKITEEVMNNVEEYISKVKLFDKGISLSCKNGNSCSSFCTN